MMLGTGLYSMMTPKYMLQSVFVRQLFSWPLSQCVGTSTQSKCLVRAVFVFVEHPGFSIGRLPQDVRSKGSVASEKVK